MDQHQIVEREKSIVSAVSSARSYLERYPDRSVSITLSNTLTISNIVGIEINNRKEVEATVAESARDGGGGKTVKVSAHDIVSVSQDNADLVSPEKLVQRSKDILNFAMARFNEGVQSGLFDQLRAAMTEDARMLGAGVADMDDKMKALFVDAVRDRVRREISDIIYRVYRPYIDFTEFRERVLIEADLAHTIRDKRATLRDQFLSGLGVEKQR